MSYSAMEVAKRIIDYCNEREISISNLKLQKLLYFAWIYFFRETERDLFADEFCAWPLGPVNADIYFEYCIFGGRNIDREYPEVRLNAEDEVLFQDFMAEYEHISVSRLVDKSHETGGAWDRVYKGGSGYNKIIPYSLVRNVELDI